MTLRVAAAISALFLMRLAPTLGQCEPGPYDRVTSNFMLSGSTDQGAVGDVIAIDISLQVNSIGLILDGLDARLFGYTFTGCYDGQQLELLDQIQYSEFFDNLTLLSGFASFGGFETPSDGPTQGIWRLFGNLKRESIEPYLGGGLPFPFMTLFFRIRGEPEQTAIVDFCDDTFAGNGCSSNHLLYSARDASGSRTFEARSTKHLPGSVRILPGEPTRPDPPAVPANARIYEEAPTPETASIRLELEGPSVTHPGATDVAFRVFVISNFEFSGFMTAVRFPAEHMTLARVDEATRPGVVLIDNERGGFGILLATGRRRVGAEGERVHAATLHFDVKESAAEASRLELRFEPFDNYFNWLAIHHREGLQAEALPITAEVGPLFVANALVGVQTRPTRPGDVNLDYALDLSDAVALLGHLFLGDAGVFCAAAGDWDADARINITDPIGILNHLFLGDPPREGEVDCD